MISSAIAALQQIFTPDFRAVLWKLLGLTLALLVLVWLAMSALVNYYVAVKWPWVETAIQILSGLGLLVGMAFLIAPVSSLLAGIFLDELAEKAERSADPPGPPGTALPAGRAMLLASRFALLSLVVNICALFLLLVPGINVIAFLCANAYLLGREYFELAAMRYRSVEEAQALRKHHALYIFLCGLPIAGFLAVPVLNLLTPLFATAFMVQIHKKMPLRR